jgi:hypothetical protein
MQPQWLMMWSRGSAQLRGAVVDRGVEYIKEAGYNSVLAFNNAVDKPASVWARLYRRAGSARKLADVMEVTFKDVTPILEVESEAA